MTIEQKVNKYLEEGKVKWKEKSQSIYYDIDIVDKDENGKDKKYFELSDLMKNPYINEFIIAYIINSKKGIGKTYQMKKLMQQAEEEGVYFMFIRRIEPDIENQKIEWNETDDSWPYFIKGKSIYRKEDKGFVGRVTTISTLYSETGLEFPNYKYIFFDEFKDKRGGTRYITKEFNKFVKFTADLQRNKPDIKIFMFSNDETKYDPYTEGLHIDPDNDYFIDLYAGVFYVNLRDKFKGAITNDTVAYRLAKYDKDLLNELDNNETVYDDSNNMIGYSKAKIDEIQYQFILNKKLYVFGFNLKDNIAIIRSINRYNRDPHIITYAMTTNDYIAMENTIQPQLLENMVRTWYNMMNKQMLFFCIYDDKVEIETFICKVLGVIKRRIYR